jgi:MFS family permease
MQQTAVADRWPDRRYSWYVVIVLCVCGMVAFVDRQIINLLVEDIKRDLAISDTQISLLQGLAFALFYALMAVPLGRLADSGSRRWIITIGIAVWTLAAMACGFATTFLALFVARMFVGIGEATLTPSGFSMLADMFRPQKLALPLSIFTGSSFFGSGVALLAGGWVIGYLDRFDRVSLPLLGELAPWQAAFILGALPGLLLAAVFFVTVREPERRQSVRMGDAAAQPSVKPSLAEVAQFCRTNRRVFFAVFIGVSLISAAQFSLGAWVPAFMIRNYDWTPTQIGYAYGLIFLTCGTSGVVFGGWLTDYWLARGRRDAHLRVAMISALIPAPLIVAFALVNDPNLAIVLLAFVVLFGTIVFGSGPSLIPAFAPPRMRALLVAIYLLVANILGQAGGPWLVAVFTDYVFGAPQLVRYSLAVVPPGLLLLGAVLIAQGRKPLREMAHGL